MALADCPSSFYFVIKTNIFHQWLQKWKIKINTTKSSHLTFSFRRECYPPVALNGMQIPVVQSVKYLGLYLDNRLTLKEHIKTKRKFLNFKTKKMCWLLGPKSELKLFYKKLFSNRVDLWNTVMENSQTLECENITTLPV